MERSPKTTSEVEEDVEGVVEDVQGVVVEHVENQEGSDKFYTRSTIRTNKIGNFKYFSKKIYKTMITYANTFYVCARLFLFFYFLLLILLSNSRLKQLCI